MSQHSENSRQTGSQIARTANGSIDYDSYARHGRALRSQAFHGMLRNAWKRNSRLFHWFSLALFQRGQGTAQAKSC